MVPVTAVLPGTRRALYPKAWATLCPGCEGRNGERCGSELRGEGDPARPRHQWLCPGEGREDKNGVQRPSGKSSARLGGKKQRKSKRGRWTVKVRPDLKVSRTRRGPAAKETDHENEGREGTGPAARVRGGGEEVAGVGLPARRARSPRTDTHWPPGLESQSPVQPEWGHPSPPTVGVHGRYSGQGQKTLQVEPKAGAYSQAEEPTVL